MEHPIDPSFKMTDAERAAAEKAANNARTMITGDLADNLHANTANIVKSMEKAMPESFYHDVPAYHPAVFSTNNGEHEFRSASNPPPPVIARSDIAIEIQRKANNLRNKLPSIAATISEPLGNWKELYKYFDAHDIQVEGPAFLYYVLNQMGHENRMYTAHFTDQNRARQFVSI